jgi:hypothetical protein
MKTKMWFCCQNFLLLMQFAKSSTFDCLKLIFQIKISLENNFLLTDDAIKLKTWLLKKDLSGIEKLS